jgi:hypothetical protein
VNIIDFKWVFDLKQKYDDSTERYEDTLSRVAKPSIICLLLSMALTHGWHLRQLDIQNAFLHGVLKEEVFICHPLGFEDSIKPDYLCHLDKDYMD